MLIIGAGEANLGSRITKAHFRFWWLIFVIRAGAKQKHALAVATVTPPLPHTTHSRRHTPAAPKPSPSSTVRRHAVLRLRKRSLRRAPVGRARRAVGPRRGSRAPRGRLAGLLRAKGLITYPSPLLGPLLEEWSDVLAAEVLPWLPPTDLAMFARVGPATRAAVVYSELPRAGARGGWRPRWRVAGGGFLEAGPLLKVEDFVGSVERLAWAKDNGCPWNARTSAIAARSGRVNLLRWAREHGCEWDEVTCEEAAMHGHLEVLKWAREHGCPWVEVDEEDSNQIRTCCACAAAGGHLEVLKWLREQDCP